MLGSGSGSGPTGGAKAAMSKVKSGTTAMSAKSSSLSGKAK